MNTHSRFGAILAATILLSPGAARSEDCLQGLVQKLAKGASEQEMDKAVRAAMEERSALERSLTKILGSSSSVPLKVRACFLLGEYRAQGAIQDLIANMTLKSEVKEFAKIPLWGLFPCQEALLRIGKPAERELLAFLGESGEALAKEGALQILIALEGVNGAESLIQDKAAESTGEEKQRLMAAVERLKRLRSQS